MAEIRELPYETWDDFKANLFNELCGGSIPDRGNFLFRGQQHEEWNLISSFDRLFADLPNDRRQPFADRLLERFVDECQSSGERHADLTDSNRIMWLALAQNHGLPTRLLDWSESPYIAAFFAFSTAIMSTADNGCVAIWVLDAHNDIWQQDQGVTVVSPSWDRNPRLQYQRGRFTLARGPHRTIEDYVRHSDTRKFALAKVLLPYSESVQAIRDLDLMQINYSRLFPGFDGCAKSVHMRAIINETV